MAYILNIETSSTTCSVALASGMELISFSEITRPFAHAESLNSLIRECLRSAEIDLLEVSAIAVSEGPGSYTGLRIGLSTCKGLCYSLGKPLIAINTLLVLATPHEGKTHQFICSSVDARRDDAYLAIFDNQLNTILPTQFFTIKEGELPTQLFESEIIFAGSGSNKIAKALNRFDVTIHTATPSAKNMIQHSHKKYEVGDFEDLAYFEPAYHKKVHITTSKRRIV